MKILWLSHLVPYPPRSGVAQRSFGLLSELCRRHEVTLMAFQQRALMRSMSDNPEGTLEEAKDVLANLCSRVLLFEIPSERRAFGRHRLALKSLISKDPYTINWLKSAEFANAVARENDRRHDLIHFDTISLAVYRESFSAVPCVMNHHNVESHLLHRRASNAESFAERVYCRQEASRLEAYERRSAGLFELHVTCSELDTQRLLEVAPGTNCCVIPNGVDVDYFDYRPRAGLDPTFSFVGTLGWGPNRQAAEFICNDLWKPIVDTWPQARFHLVGSSPPQVANDLAEKDDRFTVTGFVEDVRPLMADSCFFLCPIREGGGTKLKILNAMSMGKIVIADPIAFEGIDVTPDQNVLLARTPDEYVRQIETIMQDHSRYEKICRAARELIEQRYSYAVIGAELDRQYSALVGASTHRD